MSTISVKKHFAAGHRILGLTGPGEKCRNLHGHTFTVTWEWEQHPDIEFGMLKRILGNVIARFDHAFIADSTDDICYYLDANMLRSVKLSGPPTTEAISEEIARMSIELVTEPRPDGMGKTQPALYPAARLLRVILEEGPENCATYEVPQRVSPNGSTFARTSINPLGVST